MNVLYIVTVNNPPSQFRSVLQAPLHARVFGARMQPSVAVISLDTAIAPFNGDPEHSSVGWLQFDCLGDVSNFNSATFGRIFREPRPSLERPDRIHEPIQTGNKKGSQSKRCPYT
jgi:hypothetical protein